MTALARIARDRATVAVAAAAVLALAAVPWGMGGGATAVWRAVQGDAGLALVGMAALAALVFVLLGKPRAAAIGAAAAIIVVFAAGFAAGPKGTAFGLGAALALVALVIVLARSLAARGLFKGDKTVALLVIGIAALLLVFVLLPVGRSLVSAVADGQGHFAPGLAAERLFNADIWSLACLTGTARCGVAVNSALLATLAGVLSTLLGLVLALVIQRGGQRFGGLLRVLSILPIITPPFVVALAIVVLFGRTGLVTGWLDTLFGLSRSRWIYGLPGLLLAQLLSFAPVAFMLLYGALNAISPALEEAAQTLRAGRGRVFRTVT